MKEVPKKQPRAASVNGKHFMPNQVLTHPARAAAEQLNGGAREGLWLEQGKHLVKLLADNLLAFT